MYKVYIQNLSDASRTLIYQSNSTDSLIEEPKVAFDWDQPVNFSFSIHPGHPAYSSLTPMVTFVTVDSDDNEIFFGRVLTSDKDIFGKKEIYCEGALSFLSDSELSEYESTTSISSFFSNCINQHNSQVESRKRFSVGTVEFTDTNVYFKHEDNVDPKSTLDEQLVKRFGGCITIKKTQNGHSINYLKQVGETKTNLIRLGENVKDRTDHESGESIFSILRPIGGTNSGEDNPVTISENDGLIEIPAMIAKYGRIIKKETFSDKFTESDLRTAAMTFIERLGMMDDKPPITVDISYVDFCYLNPSIGKINFGDVFNDIEGYPGEAMVVGRMELDLSNPANDTISLYNKTYLDSREYSPILSSSTGSTSSAGAGGRGGGGGGGSALAEALADMEEEQNDVLNIGGEDIKRLNIHANSVDGYITLSSHQISLQSEVLFGSNRTYDMISTDVEEMWGSQVHADGNGFWNMYGTVVRDDLGRIVVKGDSGLAVEKTDENGRKVTVGVYDELGLTAGLLVDKINSESTTYILGDRLIFSNAKNTYAVVRPELADNPKALGYYELQNGSYVPTNDLEREPNKNYYVKKYSVGPGGDTIASKMEKESNRISLVVEGFGENAHIKPAAIVLAINDDGGSNIKLSADTIDIDGIVEKLRAISIYVASLEVAGHADISSDMSVAGSLDVDMGITADQVKANYIEADEIKATEKLYIGDVDVGAALTNFTDSIAGLDDAVGDLGNAVSSLRNKCRILNNVEWKQATVVTGVSCTAAHVFTAKDGKEYTGMLVTSVSTGVLSFLG